MAEPTPQTAAVPLEPAVRALPAWPADTLPSAEDAERAVRAVLHGAAGGLDPTLASRVGAELTEVERLAFESGGDDTAAVRAAAALRWRLGAAVTTAPERGPVDADAVAQLLVDADAVLGALQASSQDAPPALVEAVAAIRKALVADAISLQNAVTRLGAPAPQAAAPAAGPKPAAARVLSVVEGELVEPAAERRSPWKIWALLVVAALGAGGWHAYSYLNRPAPPPPPMDGAPLGMVASPERGGRTLLVTQDGRPLAAAELERLVAVQKAKGKRVVELSRGVYAVEPEGAPAQR